MRLTRLLSFFFFFFFGALSVSFHVTLGEEFGGRVSSWSAEPRNSGGQLWLQILSEASELRVSGCVAGEEGSIARGLQHPLSLSHSFNLSLSMNTHMCA